MAKQQMLFSGIKPYAFIVFLSLLPLYSLYTTENLIHTHDGLVHLPRIAAYFKALADMEIPTRWAGDLNYGYGMPLFNFIYQLPYLVASVFLFFGLGLVTSFKIALGASFLLSGVFMYLFAKELFKDQKKALLVTVFYQFAPFHLIEVLVRGSFGEVYTYAFAPLVLFGVLRLLKTFTYQYFLLTVFATALLVFSHNAMSLVFFATVCLFLLFFVRSKVKFLQVGSALFFGLLLSFFYWFPAIFEHKYTYGDLFMKSLYLSHFPPLLNFFIPNLTNSPYLQTGGISVGVGPFHVLALSLSIFLLFSRKLTVALDRRIFLYSLLLFLIALFFMQPVSLVFWKTFSLLRQFQFPWRFLAISVLATSLLSVSFFRFQFFYKTKVFVVFLLLVVLSTIFYWRPSLGMDRINESYYWNFSLNTTYYGETDVIWSAGPAKSYPKKRVEIIAGKGEVTDVQKKTNKQKFHISAKTDTTVVSHTQYYPGWRAYVDKRVTPIEFQDQNWRGLITFRVPKGDHQVEVVFGENPQRLAADIVSLASLLLLLLFPLFRKITYEKK